MSIIADSGGKGPSPDTIVPSSLLLFTEETGSTMVNGGGEMGSNRARMGESVLTVPNELVLLHLHVPLMDCINYASLNCSGCVHNAHCMVKLASNISSLKRD
jgi:hypothetical protein